MLRPAVVILALAAAGACGGGSPAPGDAGGHDAPEADGSGATAEAGPSDAADAGSSDAADAGVACVDAALYADLFSISDGDLCATTVLAGAKPASVDPATLAWGRHGGPLFVASDGDAGATFFRFTGSPDGGFASATTMVAANLPAGVFIGSALDLGFFGWTALDYTGAFPATQGEIVLADSAGTVVARYPANAPSVMGSVADDARGGRLLYVGQSKLDDAQADTIGLYAADSCASPDGGALEPGAGSSCAPPSLVAAWGDLGGALAVDGLGDVFAVMSSAAGTSQEARGFARSQIARGAPPASGTPLFTVPGYGTAMAALAPVGSAAGILAFQPVDGTSLQAQDVIEQRYQLVGGAPARMGMPTRLLKLAKGGTALGLSNDDAGHLWVAAPRGADGLVFVVVARRR
jgi:hypothetical protein